MKGRDQKKGIKGEIKAREKKAWGKLEENVLGQSGGENGQKKKTSGHVQY